MKKYIQDQMLGILPSVQFQIGDKVYCIETEDINKSTTIEEFTVTKVDIHFVVYCDKSSTLDVLVSVVNSKGAHNNIALDELTKKYFKTPQLALDNYKVKLIDKIDNIEEWYENITKPSSIVK